MAHSLPYDIVKYSITLRTESMHVWNSCLNCALLSIFDWLNIIKKNQKECIWLNYEFNA